MDALAGLLSGRVTRVVTAVPSNHIYGFLFTILLPGRLGDVPVTSVRAHAPGSVVALAGPGDLVIGHPAWWAAVLRSGCKAWQPGVIGVTSTAPCPPDVATGLLAAGLERLLQIHGSSETAGIGWRDNPAHPYTLLPHWSGAPPDGLRRLGSGHEVRLFLSPDRLEWDGDRQYHIRGRLDQAMQVGGTNVFPERVRQVLLEHPLVADAAVRLMHPSEGARLKAFIVPYRNQVNEADRRSIAAFAEARLSVPERPRAYAFGAAVPRNALGKDADWPIVAAPGPVLP